MKKGLYILLMNMMIILMSCAHSTRVIGQEQDTTKARIDIHGESFKQPVDSLGKEEFAPLDIDNDRGLYILTADEKMQMRILGSIRFLVLNDFLNNPVKKTFNTYFIPMGEDRIKIPNYYSNLSQSRFGFEVLRKLEKRELFIRLEMDFNGGSNNQFRIRHAYGKFHKFVVGQTWSLFSNVTALPKTVSADGPTGSVIIRTPQIRYFSSNKKGLRWAVALEYSTPDINLTQFNSSGISAIQIVPDITARIEKEGTFGHIQLSGVLNCLSYYNQNNEIRNLFGYGASLTGTIKAAQGKVLYQLTTGESISHFVTTFSGTGSDAALNHQTGKIDPTWAFGGFVGYDYNWNEELSSNIVFGYSSLENRSYQEPSEFSSSYSLGFNTFWKVLEGAKLGLEYIYGNRTNKGGQSANANRVSVIFAYDF